MKFRLTNKLISRYPDVLEYVVVARGVNNEIAGKWILDRASKVTNDLEKKGEAVLNEPRYGKWIEVYEDLAASAGLKSKDFLPSHVALAKRVLSGKGLPNINPIVNLYNLYSVEHGVPIGGEDLSQVYGDLRLDITDGTERFVEIGSDKIEVLGAREVAWIDDHSVTCRMWAWRQCERTKLTKNSRDMYFIFDGFMGLEGVDLEAISARFAQELEDRFGADADVYRLDDDAAVREVDYATKDIEGVDLDRSLQGYLTRGKKKKSRKKMMSRKQTPLGLVDANHLTSRLGGEMDACLGLGKSDELSNLDLSARKGFGDVSSTLPMRLAKEKGESPQEIAKQYVRILNKCDRIKGVYDEVSIAGSGFINLKLSDQTLLSELSRALSKGTGYGSSDVGENRVILIESPSINPNAAAHAGHLLNLFIGRALGRLFEKVGFDVSIDNLINDRGVKICMAMWGVEHLATGEKTPESEGMKPDQFVGKYYVEAKERYASDRKVKEEIDQMLRDWESGKKEVLDEWKKVVEWAYEGHIQTFKRLGEERGYVWLESEIYKGGRDIILKHLGEGIIEKLPDGAVIGRLEETYGLPDVVLLRSDGTSLYHTQDVNLTIQKIKKFNPWKAIWVVGNEQIVHFQQLFALLDALGILSHENLYHLAYGIVKDVSGARLGKSAVDATADAILDQMKEAAKKVIEEREIDVVVEDEDVVAEAVGSGALRYAFLSRDPFKDIVYDPESAVSFTGRSGPYVMYSYARGKSVMRKVLGKDSESYRVDGRLNFESSSVDISEVERELLLKLLTYPETVLSAANNYAPNIVGEYLFDIASTFNNFYETMPIAKAEKEQQMFRLALTELTTTVLADGMKILGMTVLEKM